MGILIGLLTIAILALFVGLITMLLWNWLMPTIFGLPYINYWQGYGLTLLAQMFFKNSSSSKKE